MSETPDRDVEVERFREYLVLLARMQLGKDRRAKVDASDVVQQTMLRAHERRHQFRGSSDAEMAGWLRRILATTMSNAKRAAGAERRDAQRERSMLAELDQSSCRLEAWIAAEDPTPSQQMERHEMVLRVVEAMAKLQDGQREALILRHCQGLPLADVAERLGCTPPSVVGLLNRGLRQLREYLRDPRE